MAGKGELVGGSPSNSIATKHGGSSKELTHKKHPGGHHKSEPRHGFKHGPRGKKM